MDIISVSIENDQWKGNILGSDNPETLLRTTFHLIGLNFGMRAGGEHRKLSANSFSFHPDGEGQRIFSFFRRSK